MYIIYIYMYIYYYLFLGGTGIYEVMLVGRDPSIIFGLIAVDARQDAL